MKLASIKKEIGRPFHGHELCIEDFLLFSHKEFASCVKGNVDGVSMADAAGDD